MRSSFFEYHVASSGLFAARAGLETVSHNLANAATPGYSRQVAEMRAARPLANYGRGMVGTGAEHYGVDQVRNFYLDKKYWSESAVYGEYNQKRTQLTLTETILNEAGETGMDVQFTGFFSRLSELTENSSSATYRKNVTQLGDSMATYFKSTYTALQKQQKDIDDEMVGVVKRINSLGTQIANINKRIAQYELNGDKANDLRDQRARLVDELSQFVNVTVQEDEMNEDYAAGKYPEPEDRGKSKKEFRVFINGKQFVDQDKVRHLEARQRKGVSEGKNVEYYKNPEDATGLHDIYWEHSDMEFDIHHPNLSGELKALADVRDGNNANYLEKQAGSFRYNQGTNELTVDIDIANDRFDLNPAGGTFTVTRPNGMKEKVNYSAFKMQEGANGPEAVFTLTDEYTTAEYDSLLSTAREIVTGKTSDYKGLPHYMAKMNKLVRVFAKAINEGKHLDGTEIDNIIGHVDGYNNAGKNLETLFFTYKDKNGNEVKLNDFDVYQITADNIVVNDDLLKDPNLLATSTDETAGIGDNRVILSFLEIQKSNSLFREGNIHDFITGMTTELAVDVQQAELFEKSYTEVVATIDNQRKSVSGVYDNEEIVNMIAFQTQFRSTARLMNVIDGIYDQMINNMGLI